jgi:hypothetical protein
LMLRAQVPRALLEVARPLRKCCETNIATTEFRRGIRPAARIQHLVTILFTKSSRGPAAATSPNSSGRQKSYQHKTMYRAPVDNYSQKTNSKRLDHFCTRDPPIGSRETERGPFLPMCHSRGESVAVHLERRTSKRFRSNPIRRQVGRSTL